MNSYFSPEALEVLQEAYEMQLTPEDQDIDAVTGLPSNTVSGTSPWHGRVDLWKYPDGVNPSAQGEIYYHPAETEEDEVYPTEDTEGDMNFDDSMSEEEIDSLLETLFNSDNEVA